LWRQTLWLDITAGRDRDWQNFQKKIKEKRVATGKEKKAKEKGAAALPEDNTTVQRLSTEVTGKLQKYSRIGTRVFVPYEFEEYTIENIKIACMKQSEKLQGVTGHTITTRPA